MEEKKKEEDRKWEERNNIIYNNLTGRKKTIHFVEKPNLCIKRKINKKKRLKEKDRKKY